MISWLLDTGPLVAYLDAGDSHHEAVAAAIGGFRGRFVLTGAVVVEVMHFVSEVKEGPAALLLFLERSRAEVIEISGSVCLRECVALMGKYGDVPMDFADATLVWAGARLGIHDVCTLDRRGFCTYRTGTGKRFRLVLDG